MLSRLVPAVVALLLAAPALAQSDGDLAEARRLFQAGLDAANDHDWETARARFEESLAITERASTLLNLAAAQAETGAVVESAASYRRFLEIATGRDARHRDEAEEALEGVEARIAHLEIDTGRLESGDSVELDDRTLLPGALAAPIALNPGTHRIAVSRDGDVVFEEEITLAEGQRQAMTIDAGERAPEAEPPPIVAATPEPTTSDSSAGDDGVAIGVGIGVTVGVLAIAGAVVGIVFATMPQSSGELYMGNVGDGTIRF